MDPSKSPKHNRRQVHLTAIRALLRIVQRFRKKDKFGLKKKGSLDSKSTNSEDHELEDFEMQVVRYKPEGLDALCRQTKFSRKELQIMYRGFKQECPTGIVNEETFKEIYSQFFPQGAPPPPRPGTKKKVVAVDEEEKIIYNSSGYAHYVFNTFDKDNNGSINFEEFVMGLSVLSRGTLHEKLQWAFDLYDINGDGIITKEEMYDIVSAIYDMMGRFAEPCVEETTAQDHVEQVFKKMDLNQDGVISMDEFMDTCRKDKGIRESLDVLDTVLAAR